MPDWFALKIQIRFSRNTPLIKIARHPPNKGLKTDDFTFQTLPCMRSNAYPINLELIVSHIKEPRECKTSWCEKANKNYERSIKFIDFQSIYTFIKSITPIKWMVRNNRNRSFKGMCAERNLICVRTSETCYLNCVNWLHSGRLSQFFIAKEVKVKNKPISCNLKPYWVNVML